MRLPSNSKRTPQAGAIQHLVLLVIGLFTAIYFQAQPKVHVGHDEPGTFEAVPANMLMMPAPPPISLDSKEGFSWPILKAAFVALSLHNVLEVNAHTLDGIPFAGTPPRVPREAELDELTMQSGLASAGPPPSPFESTDTPLENDSGIGDAFQYSDKTRQASAAQSAPRSPVKIPVFDMEPYMKAGPGRIIYFNKTELKDVSHDETAVFVMRHGDNLVLDGCSFPGGVIVQTSDGKSATGGYMNKVRLRGGTKIGGGAKGASVHIGLLAPAYELQYTYAGGEYATQIDIEGFTAVAKMNKAHQIQMKGMVLTYDAEKMVWNTHLQNDDNVAENLPDGVEYRMVLR